MQYFIAFLEGIITFISPCLLPMLPVYISYFAGGGERTVGKTLKNAFGFAAGFTVVFVAMGALAGTLGGFFTEHRPPSISSQGLSSSFFGLHYLGVFRLGVLNGTNRPVQTQNLGFFSSLLFGLCFPSAGPPASARFSARRSCWPPSRGRRSPGCLCCWHTLWA